MYNRSCTYPQKREEFIVLGLELCHGRLRVTGLLEVCSNQLDKSVIETLSMGQRNLAIKEERTLAQPSR